MKPTAYDEGWNSYFSGISLSNNPHSYDLEECSNHMEWEAGWYSALSYSEYEEQQYRGT